MPKTISLHNDQISYPEFVAMRASIGAALDRLETGLKYGEDMRSSTFVCAHDAMNILSGIVDQIAGGK